MGFRGPLLFLFLLTNAFVYVALRATVSRWVSDPARRRKTLWALHIVFMALNLPLATFFFRRLNLALERLPTALLEVVFYPSTAWLATVIAFFLLIGPLAVIWALIQLGRRIWPSRRHEADLRIDPSRRSFVAGSAGLLVPGLYAVAAYGTYGNIGDLDISPEQRIPIRNLPRSLEGMTIAQISDLHVGAYVREKELRRIVDLVNDLRPDLVVVTGDILDWDLSSLPDAVRGLEGLKAPLGKYAVLGNHDIYADRYSYAKGFRGGVEITKGMDSVGIRTLRNEVVELGDGPARLGLMGLDWLSSNPNAPNFFGYIQGETRRQLARMSAQLAPETPRILLAHHPDTFGDVQPYDIGLTLSGHTHGGGQILLGTVNGVPLGVGLLRFKYLSGLYQEQGVSLYVNRGIGYLGVPIRINCPPEISRFRLTAA
jgi:uncharacterized protein